MSKKRRGRPHRQRNAPRGASRAAPDRARPEGAPREGEGQEPREPRAPAAPRVQLPRIHAFGVARWARRFRRLSSVATFAGDPDWPALEHLRDARHGGVGVPRMLVKKLDERVQKRFEEKPFLSLDLPDDGLSRLALASGPRAPAHLVSGAVHALAHGAPLVVTRRADALALGPLVSHAVALPGGPAHAAVRGDLDAILRGATAAVQDGYGQIEKAGQAVLDLATGKARERTLQSLLVRLTRVRRTWAEKDASRRFRRIVDLASAEAAERGVAKGESDPLALTQPVVLGYVDLLPLFLTRMHDLQAAFASSLSLLALGVGVVVLVEGPREAGRARETDDASRAFASQ